MHRIPPRLAPAVFLPGLIFESLVRARGALYSFGLAAQRRLPNPVISIGNLTMGGSGKTPLVISTARIVTGLGYQPAILTRGYKRKGPAAPLVLSPGETAASPAEALGDEPALMRRHLPSSWMGISKNRFATGQEIARRAGRVVFILDDGFQHRRLHRDLDIVVIDASQPLASNRIFPRGTLREPPGSLKRCGAVVVNRGAGAADAAVESEIRSIHPAAAVFHCLQRIGALVPFARWRQAGPDPAEESERREEAHGPAYVVAALGNPGRFLRDLRQMGIEVSGTSLFRDHHQLSPKDWQACSGDARRRGARAIVVTEKDAVKIGEPPDFPLLVAVQSTEIDEREEFECLIRKTVEERR